MYDCNFFLPVLMQECKQLHVHASSFKKRGTYEGRCPCVLFPGVRFSSSESKKKAAKQYPFRRHLPEIHCFKEKKEVLNPNVTLSCEFGLGQGSKKDPKCYFVCVALLVRQSVINWHSRFFVNLFIRKIFSNIVSPQVQFLFGHVFLRAFFLQDSQYVSMLNDGAMDSSFFDPMPYFYNIDSIPPYMTSQITFIC